MVFIYYFIILYNSVFFILFSKNSSWSINLIINVCFIQCYTNKDKKNVYTLHFMFDI